MHASCFAEEGYVSAIVVSYLASVYKLIPSGYSLLDHFLGNPTELMYYGSIAPVWSMTE